MKIEWMNDELTRVRITKGIFRRRRAELVRKADKFYGDRWYFVVSGSGSYRLSWKLEAFRDREIKRRKEAVDWISAVPFPKAQLVKR